MAKTKNTRKTKTKKKSSSLVSKSKEYLKKGSSLVGLGTQKKEVSINKPKSAKTMLKKAYERKAKRLVRMGMLGQARRVLRKKATVI